MSTSILFDSMTLSWENLSGCASHMASINIRLWPDGVVPSKKRIADDIIDKNQVIKSPKSAIDDPIIYNIPRSCLKQVPRDGNIFSMTLSSSKPCLHVIRWIPLDKCRKYALEVQQAQYSSSSWTGPAISQIVFVSTQGNGSFQNGIILYIITEERLLSLQILRNILYTHIAEGSIMATDIGIAVQEKCSVMPMGIMLGIPVVEAMRTMYAGMYIQT